MISFFSTSPSYSINCWIFLLKVIEGFGVSRVLESDNPNFKPGDVVTGITGWEEYSLIQNTDQLRKIQQDGIPLSYYVGLLGMFSFRFKS